MIGWTPPKKGVRVVRSTDPAFAGDVSAYTIAEHRSDGTIHVVECGYLWIRKVRSARRARRLRRRGTYVHWSAREGCWLWEMTSQTPPKRAKL